MSNKEKRFIVVSPSHHKKPRTMFLSKTNSGRNIWCDFVPGITTLWLLSEAQEFAANSPVAIWFIEDKDWISSLDTGDMPKFADILKYAQKSESEIIRYKPEKNESIILLRVDLGHGGNRGNYHWITRVGAKYGEWNFKTCESIFDARPFDTIKEVDNYLGALPLDKYNIFVSEHNRQTRVMIGTGYVKTTQRAKNDAQQNKGVISGLQQPTETIADDSKVVKLPKEEQPETKKRVGYVLYRLDSSGEKYYHFCKQSFNFEFKGKPVYIATNKIWADFKASALSSGDFGMPAWQVEEIEF